MSSFPNPTLALTLVLLFNVLPVDRRKIFLGMFLTVAVFSLGWQIGMQVEHRKNTVRDALFEERFGLSGSGVTFREDPEKEVDLSLLLAVWRMLDRNYVDPSVLTIDTLRFGAVKGLVEAVGDPYSAFMTPVESSEFQRVLQGTLEGIGAELTMRDGQITVVAPLKGSPASRAGLLPSDVVVKVDGISLDGVNLQEAVRRIRGERGTKVMLAVFRPSTSADLTFEIVREKITVPSTEHEVLKTATGAIGYVAINQFGDDTTKETRAALEDLKKHRLSGAILDLRFNGGGYLDGSIEVVSFFLAQGKVVGVYRRGEAEESHFVLGDVILPDLPLVVLINEGSASASEIVAGALQDNRRAVIVGAKSFGKGTVQDVIDLPGGSSLRVTVAKWKTPSGRDLGKEGVHPDLAVPMKAEDYVAGRDPQKAAAIEYLFDHKGLPSVMP